MNWLVELLFPRRCPVCDEVVKPAGAFICRQCRPKLKYVKAPRCYRCGKQLSREEEEYCHDCGSKPHVFTGGRSLYVYESVAASIYRFKYQARREYAQFYGQEVVRHLGDAIREMNPQALVPVPLHASKYRKRGYNQAQLLAEEIGRQLQIPVKSHWIVRTRNTLPQKTLNIKERQNNLKRAFKIHENDVKLNTIIIIDDIYTTGSTIDAVAEKLLTVGVRNVYFITLASGAGM